MTDLKSALEAVLFAAGDPVPIGRLSLAFAAPPEEIESAAALLAEEYEREGRGIRLLRMEDRLQLCSAPDFVSLITKTLEQRRPPMLSAAALETLAIVAYYQPVTRAVVEKMRGVDSSYTVSSLQDPSKSGPGLGSFSRADRGIGGVRPVAPPTWLRRRCTDEVMPGTLVFPSSETSVLGNFWGRIKGAKYRIALQD